MTKMYPPILSMLLCRPPLHTVTALFVVRMPKRFRLVSFSSLVALNVKMFELGNQSKEVLVYKCEFQHSVLKVKECKVLCK